MKYINNQVIEAMKGKRLAVFGANNVTEEVTAFARNS